VEAIYASRGGLESISLMWMGWSNVGFLLPPTQVFRMTTLLAVAEAVANRVAYFARATSIVAFVLFLYGISSLLRLPSSLLIMASTLFGTVLYRQSVMRIIRQELALVVAILIHSVTWFGLYVKYASFYERKHFLESRISNKSVVIVFTKSYALYIFILIGLGYRCNAVSFFSLTLRTAQSHLRDAFILLEWSHVLEVIMSFCKY
jgi:hypothetical protein